MLTHTCTCRCKHEDLHACACACVCEHVCAHVYVKVTGNSPTKQDRLVSKLCRNQAVSVSLALLMWMPEI